MVLQCLEKCHEIGIEVISLTCDGPPVNLTMANRLGCKLDHRDLKSSFKHPSTNEDVVLFFDPCHMIKLIRNTLGGKGSLIDNNNQIVSWNYLKELHKLQENESFHLANKLRSQHIMFAKQKMKVRLATQVFSESVAVALEFCEKELQMRQFIGASATVKFIIIMNNLFNILNSRNLLQYDFKKPVSKQNFEKITSFLNAADKYLESLKTHIDGTLLLDSERHTGFLGLKICINSLKLIYEKLINKGMLQFLPMYKICQDHIELFFGSIRSQGGYNNNPTARQFQSAYKKLLVHVQLRESFHGNCIPLEHLQILKCNPVQQINRSTTAYRAFGVSDSEENSEINDNMPDLDAIMMDHDYSQGPISEFSKYIITYIAGHVVGTFFY